MRDYYVLQLLFAATVCALQDTRSSICVRSIFALDFFCFFFHYVDLFY